MMAGALEGSVGRWDHIAHDDFDLRVGSSEVAAAVLSAGLNLDLNFFRPSPVEDRAVYFE